MKKFILQNLKVALFLFAILFVIGLIAFYQSFSWETTKWTALLAGIISLFFIGCMTIYELIYIKANKISLNDFKIQAIQEATFTVDKSIEDTKEIVENILPDKINAYKFKYNNKLDFYKTRTGASVRSWGEAIIIKLTSIDNLRTKIYAESKPVYKATLIDFGKSSLNIEKIKSEFSQQSL